MGFTFGMDIINSVINEINEAKRYIKMAIFQIHNDNIFKALCGALKKGIDVEIFTLPYDSINKNIREKVKSNIEDLKNNGAKIYFSEWGIGDPERTTTAVGRWYSFHGKFIVTDNSAIALSANMTQEPELDAMLIYDNREKIKEFNDKFNYLKKLFIDDCIKEKIKNSKYYHELLNPTTNKKPYDLLESPRTITEDKVRQHWIIDYPAEICKNIHNLDIQNLENKILENKMYIAPFEGKARDIYEFAINGAESYVYISTESFTDADMIPFLISHAVKNKEIKILTGSESQDFKDRIRELYPRLMANGVEMRKPTDPLHAKLLITDKLLIISSVNLNKMNLGYGRTKKLWRANTETVTVDNDVNIIKCAKKYFDDKFNESINVLEYLAKNSKELNYAKSIFTVFDVKPDKEVESLLSKFIIKSDIKLKNNLYNIGKYAKIIVNKYKSDKRKNGQQTVDKEDFIEALVLYYLSDRKHTESELNEKINEITDSVKIGSILRHLLDYKLIIAEQGFYKVDITKLLMGD